MLESVLSYVRTEGPIERIIFCLYDRETYDIFLETLRMMLNE